MSYLEKVERPGNFTDDVQFNFLVDQLFSKVDGTLAENSDPFPNITEKKRYLVGSFIKQWRHIVGDDIYDAARLIFANRDRRLYFVRDVNLARIIVRIFRVPRNSQDHDRLFNYKKHYHDFKHLNRIGRGRLRSLPQIIAQVVSERRNPNEEIKPTVTVKDVNETLDRLSAPDATSLDKQSEILLPFFERLLVAEIRWFSAIVLKHSTLGSAELLFFEQWHPDATALYNVCNDLAKVLWLLREPSFRLSEEDLFVQVRYPFLPQLSHKLNVSYDILCSRMKNDFFIEEKMDGDRMVMHMKANRFKFYSRRLRDYTLLYGSNYQIGSLTKHLRGAFDRRVNSIVLDGEMVAWDFKRHCILPFGTLKEAAVQEAVRQFTTTDVFEEQCSHPLFMIFDILHLNGKDLCRYPLHYRREILNSVVHPIPHIFEILPVLRCKNSNDIKEAIKLIISERSEGIMVKNVMLEYHVASRNNSWVKVKPEYLEEFGENLDLVVIGVIPGIKNSYMCGLRDADNGSVYKSFCTVANGFSDLEYDKIERLTTGKWHDYKKEPPDPKMLQFGSKSPTKWISPADSVVLEIKARSIDTSLTKTYSVGTTLHNLYCRHIREDKSADECITLNEYLEIKFQHSKETEKSQSVAENRKRFLKTLSWEEDVRTLKKIKPQSDLFSNLSFMVLSDCLDMDNGERVPILKLCATLKEYGGHITLNPMKKPSERKLLILSEKMTTKCELLFGKGYDLLKPNWIFECIYRGEIVSLEPCFLLKTKDMELSSEVSKRVDQYGDSYVVHARGNCDKYLQSLKFPGRLSDEEFDRALRMYTTDFRRNEISVPVTLLFAGIHFYIYNTPTQEEWKIASLTRKISRYFGVSTTDLNDCSFVVVPSYKQENFFYRRHLLSNLKNIGQYLATRYVEKGIKVPRIVNESFINESIRANELADPKDHIIH